MNFYSREVLQVLKYLLRILISVNNREKNEGVVFTLPLLNILCICFILNSMSNILLHVTGSISCYKACELANLLVKEGNEVQVTMSDGGLKFIQPAVFEGLTKRRVLTNRDFFSSSEQILHINLVNKFADLIVVYPATANCINRLAAGLADDLFGAAFLANNFMHPVLLAPAMNTNMLDHPATQEGLEKLSRWGTVILETETGRLACGASGKGKLLSPEKVLARINEELEKINR